MATWFPVQTYRTLESMVFVELQYSKSQVNRAGEILAASEGYLQDDQEWAAAVLANWRACHAYPINTFQATLRQKLKTVDPDAIVAQLFRFSVKWRGGVLR